MGIAAGSGKGELQPIRAPESVNGQQRSEQKERCAHCPHFWLRIGWYMGRIGSDSVCFREFPVFAGAGMRFEFHVGHSVSAGQRPFGPLTVDKTPKSVYGHVTFLHDQHQYTRQKGRFQILHGPLARSEDSNSPRPYFGTDDVPNMKVEHT